MWLRTGKTMVRSIAVASGALVLLCVLVGGVSFRVGAVMHLRMPTRMYYIVANYGTIDVGWWRRDQWSYLTERPVAFKTFDNPYQISQDWLYYATIATEHIEFAGAGFVRYTQPSAPLAVFRQIRVPIWMPAAMLALLLIFSVRWLRAESCKAREGLCRRCGYDLRASTDRCPECGEPISTSTPAASAS